MKPNITNEDYLQSRYGRQIILPELGIKGQKKLLASSVAIVGLGGLGSTCGQFLAAAGVGNLKLIDPDIVQLNNIHRQPIFSSRDCGRTKASVLSQKLNAINPDITTIAEVKYLDSDNAESLLSGSSIIIDGTDNFTARYTINNYCIYKKTIMVSSAIRHNNSSLCVVWPGAKKINPCYACAYPAEITTNTRNDCNDVGILGPIAGLAACRQALKVIDILLDKKRSSYNCLTISDWSNDSHYPVQISKQKDCLMCGGG